MLRPGDRRQYHSPIAAVVLLAVCATAGCWADFPRDELHYDHATERTHDLGDDGRELDGGRDSRTDQGVDAAHDARLDTPVDGATEGIDGPLCSAASFVRCKSATELERCNSAGTGKVIESCWPYLCNAGFERCDECDPQSPPFCSTATIIKSCTADRLFLELPCSLGCQSGACCTNGDNDGYTTCQNDCNDGDSRVRPNQTTFFTTASAGSFDYNCDKTDEPQFPNHANCRSDGSGGCTGDGWATAQPVPACGDPGTFFSCNKVGPTCTLGGSSLAVQACR